MTTEVSSGTPYILPPGDLSNAKVVTYEMIMENVLEVTENGPCSQSDTRSGNTRFDEIISLKLSRQNLHEIMNLEFLTKMTTLRLDNNMLSSIVGLEQLRSLTWLDLSYNRISDLWGLSSLRNLRNLNLNHNMISSLKYFRDECANCLTTLETLFLGNNQIASSEELHHLTYLHSLEYLDIDGNPFAGQPSVSDAIVLKVLPGVRTFHRKAV